ncbi:MAG: phage tail tape measure protein, partial [Ruminococcus sp.]|nr:phage tail tape measure protein [Ruminococcus sp.]
MNQTIHLTLVKSLILNSVKNETFLRGQVVKAAAAITAALVAIGKKAVEVGTEFDSAMSQVAATMGYSVEAINTEGTEANKTFKQLRDYAQEMGKSTAFSANEAAQALNYMALAGYDAEKSIAMLPKVLDLASSGSIELAKASDMVTDAQSALGLSIEDTEKLIDQMARTASKSNTSVEQLGEAILTIGATAKDMKGGTQELAGVLGHLANNGIKGAEGGTKLRNILLKLEAPTDKAAAKLEELGVQVLDDNDKLRSMQDIFADLSEALKNTGNRTGELSKIFNSRDLAAVNALLDTSADRWNELGEAIEDSAGAAHDMAEVQLDNLAGDITLFKSALEGAEITISDKLNPKLRETVQFGTEMVSRLADGFGQGGLAGAVEQAHKVIAEQLGEEAKLVFGIETAVEAAVAAFITYKTTMLMTEAIAALKTVNQLLIEGKTLTEALTAAQMANPYVLIATLAIGAATAVKKLIQIQTDLIDETAGSYDKLSDEQKKLVDQTKDLAKAYGESKKAFEDSNAETEKYAESNRKLVDELYKLNSHEKLSKGDKAALQSIVKKLSDSYSGLKIEIDETTGKLLTERDAIEKVIAAKEQEDKANAASEHYVEVVDQLAQAESNRANAAYQREQGYKRLGDLMVELSKKQQNLEGFLSSAGEESYWTDEQVKKYAELRAGINETSDAVVVVDKLTYAG